MEQGLASESSLIRVLVLASSVVMQAGLEAVISGNPTLEVVGRPAGAATLLSEPLSQPDVILVQWPELHPDRLPLPEETATDPPALLLLVDDWQPEAIADSLRLGIRGILPTEVSTSEMVEAIQATALGLTVLHPEMMASLLPSLPPPQRPTLEADGPSLTQREVEVLTMLAEGLGNKAIARRLQISDHTVKFHISSILSKLQVSSRTEAVIWGARQGFIVL